jgi:hypothetical protein
MNRTPFTSRNRSGWNYRWLPVVGICALALFQSLEIARADSFDIAGRTGPIAKGTGFAMNGWFVWCGSVIKAGDRYHMFASRWPETTKFPDGYRSHSEIVRAVAPHPEGPYVFQEVVIGARAAGKWDSGMAHNPAIYRVGDTFVLYYIGSDVGSRHRQIGIATAPAITGPWTRCDQPLDLGVASDANNPSACFETDGRVKLIWRTADLRVCISTARSFEGPYALANSDVWPAAKLEDFFFFKSGGGYHVVCEDNAGKITGHERWGAHIVSPDGLTGWKMASEPIVYDHRIRWADGGEFTATRRERPWLLIEDGRITHLFTAVYDGQRTWNQPDPIKWGGEYSQREREWSAAKNRCQSRRHAHRLPHQQTERRCPASALFLFRGFGDGGFVLWPRLQFFQVGRVFGCGHPLPRRWFFGIHTAFGIVLARDARLHRLIPT